MIINLSLELSLESIRQPNNPRKQKMPVIFHLVLDQHLLAVSLNSWASHQPLSFLLLEIKECCGWETHNLEIHGSRTRLCLLWLFPCKRPWISYELASNLPSQTNEYWTATKRRLASEYEILGRLAFSNSLQVPVARRISKDFINIAAAQLRSHSHSRILSCL